MSNRNFESYDPNTGTYQTGVTPKRQRANRNLVTVLLVLTIFLGGLASCLGILNIQLLNTLMRQQEPTVPVDIQSNPSGSSASGTVSTSVDEVPQLPGEHTVRLYLYAAGSDAPVLTRQQIYEANKESLVKIDCQGDHSQKQGLGTVFGPDGYILTAAHLIQSANRIYVTTADGETYRAAVVGVDVLTDLAVLYIEAQGLSAATFGDSRLLADAQNIASTCDLSRLKDGVITDSNAVVTMGSTMVTMIQTTAGSCEGPAFNSFGQVIGYNSSYAPAHFGLYVESGMGFAIPSATVQQVVNEILEYGFVAGRPTLGVETEEITAVYQKYWNLPGGLRITAMTEKARQQGLQEGDILLALDGRRLASVEDLHRILFSERIGKDMTAVIFRDGKSQTVSLTIFDVVDVYELNS